MPFPWASYLAGIAAAVALGITGFRLAGRVTADRVMASWCGLVLVCTHPFPWSALSGMESGLAAALVLATILAAAAGRTALSLGCAAAAGAVRPELTLLPLLVLGARLAARGRFPSGRRALGALLGTACAVACPFVLERLVAGSWLPGAFAAKVGRHGAVAAILEGRADLVPGIVATNLPLYLVPLAGSLWRDNAALLLLSPLGFIGHPKGGESRNHLPWMIVLLLPCAMAILAPFGGPEFQEQRYIAPFVAVVVVWGMIGLCNIPGRTLRYLVLALVIALTLRGAWRGMERYAREVANITGMQVRIGRWLRDRPGGPGAIATHDIGAIGFFTDAPILDLTGLASPEAIPYLRRRPAAGERNRGWNGASETGLLDLLRTRRPGYVAVFPSWYPSRFFQDGLGRPVYRVDLEDNLICGDRTMIVYRPDWR